MVVSVTLTFVFAKMLLVVIVCVTCKLLFTLVLPDTFNEKSLSPKISTFEPTVKLPLTPEVPRKIFFPTVISDEKSALFETVKGVPSAVIESSPVPEIVKVPAVLLKFPVSI